MFLMTDFDRSSLIKTLPAYSRSAIGLPNAQIESYLRFYSLYDLAISSHYCFGRLELEGVETAVQSFSQRNEGKTQATVVVIHGYMDHMGLYHHLLRFLYNAGYNVVCFDLSGHGLSEGDPLYVDDFEHYALQLDRLIHYLPQGSTKPIHLVGQSTGAAIVCAQSLLLDRPQSINNGHRILLAPLIRPTLWKSIKRRFRWLRYVIRRVPRHFSLSSHDECFVRFIAERDPLQHKQIPVAWVGAMLAWGDWFEQQSPTALPVSIIQGTSDRTVDWRGNLEVMDRVFPNNELCLIEHARHHLVNESEHYRSQVFSCIEAILSQH